jgi:CRISPR-associated endonuclease/helicase Cas3
MAIWLVARACGAKLPRRLVYVVDRRAVVDQATEVAVGLRTAVDGDPALRRKLGLSEGRSLPISTLRGQHVDNREWLDDPASPAIIVGTVDMIGSRLLFEGYGVSRKMRPYHAGLLGADTLVVLDEAHLVPPFEALLQAIADDASLKPRHDRLRALIPAFKVLPLSATGQASGATVLTLTPQEDQHPIVRKRLHARKHLRLHKLDKETKLHEELARRAWDVCGNGERAVRCIVFSDKRDVAEKTKAEIEKFAKGDKKAGKAAVKIDTELLVGGRRIFEREQVKTWLQDRGFIPGRPTLPVRPAFLFATSAGEVGVDLDAHHMVCDLVPWERMVQRLGRVNRRGEPEDHLARVEVVVEAEPDDMGGLLRKGPSQWTAKERERIDQIERTKSVNRLLERLPRVDTACSDVGLRALLELKAQSESEETLRDLIRGATTPAPLRPALSRALVEAWSMTSLEEHTGRPAIAPWLRGWIDEDAQTRVVWRTHLPVRADGRAATRRSAEALFEAAPPHTSEVLETETYRVVEWLMARARALSNRASDVTVSEAATVAFVLSPDGGVRGTERLEELKRFDDPRATKARREELQHKLVAATVVVDGRLGGLSEDGLLDAGEDETARTADDGGPWLGEGVAGFRVRRLDVGEASPFDPRWRERLRLPVELSADGEVRRWLIVDKWRHDASTEEDRAAGPPQLLDEHGAWAEERARGLAEALGLGEYAEMLAVAARLHDEGKGAKRWQRAFNARGDGVYAKTPGPINYALLDGYRHELGSLLRALEHRRMKALPEEQRDLALHLIASHHGFARPAIATRGCEDAPPTALDGRAKEIALRFARLQGQWGPWGLAWWEALLRAADQQASRDNEARGTDGGRA